VCNFEENLIAMEENFDFGDLNILLEVNFDY
jgi:hypothetical protein